MACDYLAIQGSATPSERAFSSGGITGSASRNRLKGDTFEALQLLKSAYRSGHIGATEQAQKHAITVFETFGIPSDALGKGKVHVLNM
jgi:hypothetical protein